MKISTTILNTSKFFLHFLIACILILTTNHLVAQLVAFPGAEGAGRFSSGGRGSVSAPTTVYEVTNLTDNNTVGSLRYALNQNVASRTIVFRVSGTIHLLSRLTIKANTTIAGQTAPGDGICIADYPTVISGDNVILRYMRFRMGDKNQLLTSPAGCGVPVAPFTPACMPLDGSGGDDALGNLGNKNIIIDHCTVSWSSDEALTIYRGDSLTVQWNIISEPLNYSYHFETGDTDFEQHGYGGIWGARNGSFHHNLIADARGRSPRFAGSSTYSPGTPGQENADFRNNVIYNWGSYSTNGGEGGNYNIVNNYYKYGPSTGSGNSVSIPVRGMIVQPSVAAPLPYGKFYVNGNYVDGYTAITNNNWLGVSMASGTQADTTLAKVNTEFPKQPVTTQSAQQAYTDVLQFAGASFARDTLDQRIVADVTNRTGRIIDVQGGFPHGTPYAQTVNAWPTLNSTPAPADTDHDGMTDVYETANSLNINDATDRNVVASNGYTNLENYLNGILNVPTIIKTGSLNPFNQNIPAASGAQTFTVSAINLTGNIIITPPANYQVSGDGGVTWQGNSSPLVIPQSGGTVAPKIVSVRLNAAAPGAYSGNITGASNGAVTVNVAVSGNAYASNVPVGTALVVAQDGTGDYTTVQAAINAVPTGLTAKYIIYIKNGKYFEKINIPSNKPFIQLVGQSVANVILYYDDGASDPLPGGGTVGTQNSASFTVNATDFSAFNITFANTYGDGTQGVAVLVNNDRAVFKNCRFLGNQDTLYIKGSGTPRHYFKDCYIDGNVDFIFGSSIAVFDSSVIYAKSRTTAGSSFITAANTPPGQAFGYVFRNCLLPNNTGATTYTLGRPWQNSNGSSPLAHNKVVFLNAKMGTSISQAGWSVWDAGTNTSLIYYGEYQSKYFNGTLVDVSQRVPWSVQLNATEAASYTNANLFGSWDPCAVAADVCTSQARDIAISNFRGAKGATNSVFNWNISWAKDAIKYELYRSATRSSGYTKVNEVIATNDTSINFQLTDVFPAAGSSFYYYLVGSKAGFLSHTTDTVQISSIPTINNTGIIQPFIQNLGTPSAAQNVTVSGENLLGNVTLTPPVNFEISSNAGTTWTANPSILNLAPTSTTLSATTIAVRLNASATGTYSDSIKLETTGAVTKYIKVNGTAAVIGTSTAVTLLWWPFTTNADDSAAVRATGVLASTPTLKNLYLSNGTTPPNLPAYSAQFGQAFGSTSNGDGSWGTAVGGPGGTLKKDYYEQFTVTAENGYEINVDSLYVKAAFHNTSSNTRLAVMYSLSNFITDSADVFTIPGGFTTPISLPNQTAGPSTEFPLSVAGLGGVNVQPGQTLTFRFYFSCGSSSVGRYAMLKDVKITGTSTDLSTVKKVIQHWPFATNANDSAAVRATGVVASTPTLYRLYSSNGTTVPTIPAYSAQFGQAFGATANGDGSWGTAAGGPGGTLQRTWYEQFTLTAASGYSIQVDSILASAAFNNTSSNTRMAVVYSLSNFTADSSDVSASPGGFVIPISLANQTGGPTNRYNLEVAGPAGITLLPGQTLTFRFYFSCGSSSVGRYAFLKDVKVIGSSVQSGPVPTIIALGTLNSFSQSIGTPSGVQAYSLSGIDLTSSVTVTPPVNYQVSNNGGTTWYGNANPLILTQSGGVISATTISVRLNGTALGNYPGNIRHTATKATAVNVPVSGTTLPVPTLTTTGSLTAFAHTVGTPSAAQTYIFSGANLVGNITITPPANFEVSADGGTTWRNNANPLTINVTGNTQSAMVISVRMNAFTAGTSSGTIVHSTQNATPVTLAVTGTAAPTPVLTATPASFLFSQIVGTPTVAQTFAVSGANLTGNVTITPPAGYELSSNAGGAWSASAIILTAAAGTVSSINISVRLNATTAGTFNGNVTVTSAGAATRNIALTGTTVLKPVIIMTQALAPFTYTVGMQPPVQAFVVAGDNLMGNITVTPPAHFQVSGNGGSTWQSNTLTLTRSGSTVAPTTISLRLNVPVTGMFAGNLVIGSPNADSVNILLSGSRSVNGKYLVYPVPATRAIFIAHPVSAVQATLTVYNASGQKTAIYQTQPSTIETKIDITNFRQGLYHVEFREGSKVLMLKFVKN